MATNLLGDREVPLPDGIDTVQALEWAPSELVNRVALGGWDGKVRVRDLAVAGDTLDASAKGELALSAPVLDVAWENDGVLYAGGCDCTAVRWSLETNKAVKVATHEAPVRACCWDSDKRLLVTGSWDRTVRYWDLRASSSVATVRLKERVYSMSTSKRLLVVGQSAREITIINLDEPTKIYRQMTSPLKDQTRVVGCFPDGLGFGLGSIEGRCAIRAADMSRDTSFAFKCHRVDQEAFAVNSVTFHPKHIHTFATCGGDGTYAFWCKSKKRRLGFAKKRLPGGITCGRFNPKGDLFAYTCGYDWSEGAEKFLSDQKPVTKLFVHAIIESEVVYRA